MFAGLVSSLVTLGSIQGELGLYPVDSMLTVRRDWVPQVRHVHATTG